MERFRIKGQIPSSVKPEPDWGEFFNGNSGFVIRAADKINAFVFYDKRLDGPQDARQKLLEQKNAVLFHVVSKHVPVIDWFVEAEPIGVSQLGLVVYKTGRKAIFAGSFTYNENKFTAELATVYPNVTNFCKLTADVSVSHTTDDGQTTVDGKIHGEYTV